MRALYANREVRERTGAFTTAYSYTVYNAMSFILLARRLERVLRVSEFRLAT